jgi:hypothetical protein
LVDEVPDTGSVGADLAAALPRTATGPVEHGLRAAGNRTEAFEGIDQAAATEHAAFLELPGADYFTDEQGLGASDDRELWQKGAYGLQAVAAGHHQYRGLLA